MSEHSLSVTLKAGRDFDAPWVVVYGDTPDEVQFKLENIEGVLKSAVSAAAALRSLHTLEAGGVPATPVASEPAQQQPAGWGNSTQQSQPQWSQPQQQAPVQQGARLHPEGKACRCGNVLNFKQVNRKSDGKQFSFWECPARTGSKDTAHDSEFAN